MMHSYPPSHWDSPAIRVMNQWLLQLQESATLEDKGKDIKWFCRLAPSPLEKGSPLGAPLQHSIPLGTGLHSWSREQFSAATSCPRTQLGFWRGNTTSYRKNLTAEIGGKQQKQYKQLKEACAYAETLLSVLKTKYPASLGRHSESHAAEHRPKATASPGPKSLQKEVYEHILHAAAS